MNDRFLNHSFCNSFLKFPGFLKVKFVLPSLISLKFVEFLCHNFHVHSSV